MTDKDKAQMALVYLKRIREIAGKVDKFERIIAREKAAGNLRRVQILEETQESAKSKLDQARELCRQVGGVEGEILEHKYICGFDDKTTAYLANYSVSRMRELAKAGRVKYGELLSELECDKTP